MDEIRLTYHGHAMFEITSSNKTTLVTDPYDEKIKERLPQVTADIVTVSHDHFDHSNTGLIKGDPAIVDTNDNRKIRDIAISAIDSYHDPQKGKLRGENIIFMIEVDAITIAHLGDLGHIPSEDSMQRLSSTDILLIPVGGIYTLNASEAYELSNHIGPKIIIPMHYKEKDSKLDVDTVDSFLRLFDDHKEKGHAISISKNILPETTEVWVFKSS